MTAVLRLRLAFVIKAMRLPGGGAEKVLATVASGLAARGHAVTMISCDPPNAADYYPSSGIDRIRLGRNQSAGAHSLRHVPGWLARLRAVMTELRPDVAIGFMHSSYLPLGAVLKGSGIPVLGSEHTVYEHYRSRPLQRLFLQTAPRLCEAITVVSQQARASFPAVLARRMIVVPNPVTIPASSTGGSRSLSARLVLAVGRLDAAKDHATLIAAFARIARRFPDWRLAIAGEGECRVALAAQIAALGLGERVSLLGPVAEIVPLYASADLFAMASRYESFGLATAEALAAGVPAIGFADCQGTNELIIHGANGVLVDPGSDRVAALAEGLASLMENPQLRAKFGEHAQTSVAQFGEQAVISLWETTLREIAAGTLALRP